jgi:hypothetical protein
MFPDPLTLTLTAGAILGLVALAVWLWLDELSFQRQVREAQTQRQQSPPGRWPQDPWL